MEMQHLSNAPFWNESGHLGSWGNSGEHERETPKPRNKEQHFVGNTEYKKGRKNFKIAYAFKEIRSKEKKTRSESKRFKKLYDRNEKLEDLEDKIGKISQE